MAWGYWSATPVADRGRSPRRNKDSSQESCNPQITQQRQYQDQNMVETAEEPAHLPQETCSTLMPNTSTTQDLELEFEADHRQLSRHPSLDLNSMISSQSALAGILCQAHANRQQGGTLSAGNTLTRLGSRHTAVEYAVPHFHHHHHAYVEYHQDHMSLSDDDSSSEPGYDCIRTGDAAVVYAMQPASSNQNMCSIANVGKAHHSHKAGLRLYPGCLGVWLICRRDRKAFPPSIHRIITDHHMHPYSLQNMQQ